uniref:Uncharacterized protein n=1 Tax=Rhizophora mucronata TaxID=61149 RepID=A0A2P2QSX6_RHIMU
MKTHILKKAIPLEQHAGMGRSESIEASFESGNNTAFMC